MKLLVGSFRGNKDKPFLFLTGGRKLKFKPLMSDSIDQTVYFWFTTALNINLSFTKSCPVTCIGLSVEFSHADIRSESDLMLSLSALVFMPCLHWD